MDLDPQQTSSSWLNAAITEFSIDCTTVPADSSSVLEQLPTIAEDSDAVVVDGPAGLSDATRAVMLLADYVLIPVQPAGADLRSAGDAVRLVKQARQIRGGDPDAAVFLNRVTKRTRLLSEAQQVLEALDGVRSLKTSITQRQVLTDAYGQGTTVLETETGPSLESATEYGKLFTELLKG